jgi:hypothetical protein
MSMTPSMSQCTRGKIMAIDDSCVCEPGTVKTPFVTVGGLDKNNKATSVKCLPPNPSSNAPSKGNSVFGMPMMK